MSPPNQSTASSQTTQPSEKHSQPPVGTSAALHQYIVQHTREPQLMRDLREETADLFPQAAHMPVFPEQAAFLAWLVAAIGARRAIEIGVFTGCSAIAVAQALPPDGSLFAIDRDPRSMAVAERYFAQAGVQHKINTRVAPAAAVLDELLTSNEHIGQYDFAFVGTILQLRPVCQHLQYPDADKRGYAGYLEQLLQLVRVGGIIAFDNVLWYGKVADPEVCWRSYTKAMAMHAWVL